MKLVGKPLVCPKLLGTEGAANKGRLPQGTKLHSLKKLRDWTH